jgi:hypothetical protein
MTTIYIRKRGKVRCQVVSVAESPFGDQIWLRYEDASRARSAGDWFVTREQFERLYRPEHEGADRDKMTTDNACYQ